MPIAFFFDFVFCQRTVEFYIGMHDFMVVYVISLPVLTNMELITCLNLSFS